MKNLFLALIISLSLVTGVNAATMFTWTPPTTNTDGTLLTDLGGYKIYCGLTQGVYTITKDTGLLPADMTGKATYPISSVLNMDTVKTYYCSVTAYDVNKNESVYSNEISVPLVGIPPSAPGGFGTK